MSVCSAVVSYAKKADADECESILCSKRIITIRITDSEIAETKESHEKSLGIRMIHKKRISCVQTTTLEPGKIVDSALKSAKNTTERKFWKTLPGDSACVTLEKVNDPKLWKATTVDISDIAQEMINSAQNRKITNISGSLNVVCEEFEIANTSGLQRADVATYVSGIINADSDTGSFPVSGIGQASSRMLSDFHPEKIGTDASEMCANSINPHTANPGITSIVFDPLAVGELLAFVFASNFSLKTYSENRSCFSEKIGKSIAAENFELVDDPHMPNGLGSKPFDDEGVPTKRTHYIRNGIFEKTYSDLYNAYKEGTTSSGNASRLGLPLGRSSDPIPMSSPHNLTVRGSTKRDDIIKDTKNGILVSRLWYTYPVNPIRGDFSCTARSGIWIISDGQIKEPVKSVRIIHNLPRLLQQVSAVADNGRAVLPWASIPVTAPTIRCEGVTISPI
ncbi:TldD/PmbA family protein [Candidatus Nitrosotenuis sp. DW1]|uniref:TldD/PmbA family protein n=1 Tax=Candidatus Nitrosotenuis sp. DW1 TaxID=2259672 RepID=UPI0015C6BFC8|nr:TldD/PmbA family protein [Candidatus Nitrosotenuis sp. DW1]QLH08663.1 TldD/PmbA family protein [Candidatus Nitrosotenuis sp. DW1]